MTTDTPRIVCFDLDGTVMVRPNSLQYLLALNEASAEALQEIDRREASGQVDWIASDHERTPWIAGLPVAVIEEHFDDHLETIGNLQLVLDALKERGVTTALITSGPIEVAQALALRFAFDHCLGSIFETADGVYTGRITRHLGSDGKVDCLRELCRAEGIALEDCAAVGDGDSDIALFKAVGVSIGINCSETAARFAHYSIQGNDLAAILPFVLPERPSRDGDQHPAFP